MKMFVLSLAFIRASVIVEGDPTKALSLMTFKALPIAEEIGDPIAQARCLYWIGKAEATRGDWDESLKALEKALQLGLAEEKQCVEGREIEQLLEIVRRWEKARRPAALDEEPDDPIFDLPGGVRSNALQNEAVPGLLTPVWGTFQLQTRIANAREANGTDTDRFKAPQRVDDTE
jgi:hypothetical protein